MKRSMEGAYWMIWSQQNPIGVLGKIVVGSRTLKVAPPSFEKATFQLAETKITPLPLAPLGSAQAAAASPLHPIPAPLNPTGLLASKAIAGGSPFGAGLGTVPVGVGVPGTRGLVGTGGALELTSLSMRGGWCGYFPPSTLCAGALTSCTWPLPVDAGGTTTEVRTLNFWGSSSLRLR